jgi:bla regulator protein blaR1
MDFGNALNLLSDDASSHSYLLPTNHKAELKPYVAAVASNKQKPTAEAQSADIQELVPVAPIENMVVRVAQDDVDASLSTEQKAKVKSTVDATKKVLGNLQWNQVQTTIAEVLTEKEKAIAKQQYVNQLNQAEYWKNVEQNMKAQYQNMDWQKIDDKMNNALTTIQLDSLQKAYTVILTQLNKLATDASAHAELNVCPLPDQSLEEIQKAREEMSNRVNTIKALLSTKKVVRL